MDKERRIRKKTWEYFWQQKAEELGWIVIIIFAASIFIGLLVVVPLALGTIIGDGMHSICGDFESVVQKCSNQEAWFEGFLYLAITWMISLILYTWVQSNWEEAESKARKSVRK